jgi:hypothetical protein
MIKRVRTKRVRIRTELEQSEIKEHVPKLSENI